MFERFTKGARTAVVLAQEEARELGHTTIGTEHLLLALTSDEQSGVATLLREAGADRQHVRDAIVRHVGDHTTEAAALADRDAEDAAALKAIGIDLEAVRAAIEENFGAGSLRLPHPAPKKRGIFGRFSAGSGHIPFSPRAKKVLELSLREALRLKHNYIAREHILLGILREGQGLAMLVLTELGADPAKLRADLAGSLESRAA
ncbi:ATP-dependent Clp protease ATP-binding subunit ClpA [Actinoplanes lutulentus]|uniref:ClpA/ClpB-like protein n=1 Tax=Actinoplanes lutulentus TaxID=1287878 RepID=A0A327ZLS4_9ACTN|nr:Clp protease N-terminal domain-containing protein [Actinoplanes lutulentus]MBB2942848.1 ATP-dependent Clp protease ATP-binding subunit ClpA [Actinoplanes lutulentus]RAK38427.1 ClpA/ClpB-like protein [Actinoplanes lutulentus]